MKKETIGMLLVWALGLCCLVPTALKAQQAEYLPEFFIHDWDSLPYRVLYPKRFDERQKTLYPLVFFLHGAGERGSDNKAQLTWGASLFAADSNRIDFPAVVVFPQCPKDSYWANVQKEIRPDTTLFHFQYDGQPTQAMASALSLFDSLRQLPYIDAKRVYVAGLSMGGMGTLELLRRRPKAIAAAIAICGGDTLANAPAYQHIPLWIFHGAADKVVPVYFSRQLAKQLRKMGAPLHYTEYPGIGHFSWVPAFQEPELLPWLFQQKRSLPAGDQ